MSKVSEAIVECQEQLVTFAPELEGLMDYERLNIQQETRAVIISTRAAYERRIGLLNRFIDTARALVADGHPDLDINEVNSSVLADLQNQEDTIRAAKAKFKTNAASGMTLEPGEPIDK